MPDWWMEATLPTVVFGIFIVLWVAIPAPDGESDFASRLRNRFRK